MRICKLIDAKYGYEQLSLSSIINEIENNFSVFLYSYRNTCGNLGELEIT